MARTRMQETGAGIGTVAGVRIIQAGAGSGKTYTLAGEVYRAVLDGSAQPERILLTTFTRKAAAELLDRVGARLIKEGLYEAAAGIREARIGTVNGICGGLLRDYAFEAGLSVRQTVLDENQAAALFRKSLSGIVSEAENDALGVLAERLSAEDWRKDVERIVGLARSNGVSPGSFELSALKNKDFLNDALGDPSNAETGFPGLLEDTVRDLASTAEAQGDGTAGTSDALLFLRQCALTLKRGERLPWNRYTKMTGLKPGVKSRQCLEALFRAAFEHFRWTSFRADLFAYTDMVFSIAGRACERYASLKESAGCMDFIDQEILCLKLLSDSGTIGKLSFDLVLVDEFQDTSPVQLALFLKLSELAKSSVWVGDPKQAIYGFRGCDPSLMMEAVRELRRGKSPERLEYSWRSVPELVKYVNDVFPSAFEPQGIEPASVPLTPKLPSRGETALESWVLVKPGKGRHTNDDDALALANGITDLLERSPSLKPSDIAVLARKNDSLQKISSALEEAGIPFEIERPGLFSTPAADLLLSAFSYMMNGNDRLSAGRVSWYCDLKSDSFSPPAWLSERCRKTVDHPVLLALKECGTEAVLRTPLQLLERAAAITRARDRTYLSRSPRAHASLLDAVFSRAKTYEDEALQSGGTASHSGLLAGFRELADTSQDLIPPGGGDGITLSTWHASKGLEWPVAVLYGLEPVSRARFFGAHAVSSSKFDLFDPLANREIVFRIFPYASNLKNNCGYLDLMSATDEYSQAVRTEEEEFVRLLYVVCTRAKNRLVFASRHATGEDAGAISFPRIPQDSGCAPGGWLVKEYACEAPDRPGSKRFPWFSSGGDDRPGYPARFVAPSSLFGTGEGRFRPGEFFRFGDPLVLTGDEYEGSELGTAVHRFFAVSWRPMDGGDRRKYMLECAGRILSGANLPLLPSALVACRERLDACIAERWSGGKIHRELPVRMEADGRIIGGSADLIVENADSFVVLDFKLVRSADVTASEYAERYGPQLTAYADILSAALGKPCGGMFLCLPLRGELLEILIEPATVVFQGERKSSIFSRLSPDRG